MKIPVKYESYYGDCIKVVMINKTGNETFGSCDDLPEKYVTKYSFQYNYNKGD